MALQKFKQAELSTYTLFFLIFVGLFRPLMLNKPMDANWAVIMTLCFFVWIMVTKFCTNLIIKTN
jgi:hypothetical protein